MVRKPNTISGTPEMAVGSSLLLQASASAVRFVSLQVLSDLHTDDSDIALDDAC